MTGGPEEASATLEQSCITQVIQQFKRDRSRYSDMVEYVRDDLDRLLAELDRNVKVQVHSRVKSADSLEGKLNKRRAEQTPPSYVLAPGGKDDPLKVLDRIPDLAGVRVLTYTEGDMKVVTDLLAQKWDSSSKDSPLELHGEVTAKSDGYYQATHLRLRAVTGLGSDLDHLAGITCEVQVTTTADHLLNEVAHDLIYKPNGAQPKALVDEITRAKGLLAEVKLALKRAVDASVDMDDGVVAVETQWTVEGSGRWLPLALFNRKAPSKLDRAASEGKVKTIPYLVSIGLETYPGEESEYLKQLPTLLRDIVSNESLAGSIDAYTDVAMAQPRLWGRSKSGNPRHLNAKSSLDKTIMALLILLKSQDALKAPRARPGRPSVAMDIVACFNESGSEAPGSPGEPS